MKTNIVSIKVNEKETVSGIISIPKNHTSGENIGVMIAHGAGNDMHNALLASYADGLTASGCLCLRFNFPYKEKGRKSPDSPKLLAETWLAAYNFFKESSDYKPCPIIAAGKSMGGRIASEMVANKLLPAERIIFLGYPFHAPGKKDNPRDAHLYNIHIPMLFFAGTRDPLCNLEKLKEVLKNLSTSWELETIEGGNHSFNLPKNASANFQDIINIMVNKTLSWISK
ncbi:MAG: dienelactone hydrolase family protein [Deltaproteobacteria bacterium]|nr:dienelactone hydrolase family protein [Deltaproteobacteria bacterium]MBW1812861.1 dienelactone hydrolase family protein [Deltaproteobacteria bacterium]MBW1846287.1 dienelactone hydrolase family protein [Deltaproteobacteria bacterium]MBW1984457.1 dienelactone hydrolase family protein [Deltaproteobacteria bacterium]MBW2179609.1 dienelactone hydrolase family protein [Deltaproteobacteria bacterium]